MLTLHGTKPGFWLKADTFFITIQEVAMLPDSVDIKTKLKGLQDRLETLRGHL
jgi:hypothetical protein